MLAAEIRHKCVDRMRGCRHWRRHLDERFVTINGKTQVSGAPPVTRGPDTPTCKEAERARG